MDAELEAAAHALSRFDPLAALKRIALRDDPGALALRGLAMAQLGDYRAAQKLLTRASAAFSGHDPLSRARCLAALGEVALAQRELKAAGRALDAAQRALEAQGDRLNALFVRLQRVRRLVLLGSIAEAAAMHRTLDLVKTPNSLRTLADLIGADIALRNLEPRSARALLTRARRTAAGAGINALKSEVERAARDLDAPVARAWQGGSERVVRIEEVDELLRSNALIVDACRREVRAQGLVVSLVTRPVLLALLVTLASAYPDDASRESLAQTAFGARRMTDSTRVRLRVEIGRLRRVIAKLTDVVSSERGYVLRPRREVPTIVLLPPAPGEANALLSLLRGGESWSSSALATALGVSQRTVQRALIALHEAGRVECIGAGRAQRWVARPPEGFATTLLLVAGRPRR